MHSHEDGTADVHLEGKAAELELVAWEVTLDGARVEVGHNRGLKDQQSSRPSAARASGGPAPPPV